MNPHFLFNSINNIYVLLQEDKDRAARILLKFSELLRYQLYDCNVSTILLNKELQFIDNYIEFETLRYSNKIQVHPAIKGLQTDRLRIAPLLLQPFIENAFKHTPKHKNEQGVIHIKAMLHGTKFSLEVNNTRPRR
jgi:two-component system LytT family sensor kinase